MKEKLFSVETPDESSGFLLWQVTNLWQREIKKALEKYDLTHSQFVLLASTLWFSQFEEGLTQISLSAHTKIDPMTTSTVLRTLQRKGFIERQDHSTDTRAKIVVLTNEGRRVAKQAVKTVELFDKAFFQPLNDEVISFNKKLITLLKQTV
jgi:DNA-binding MarR family transcriptional regulator